MLKHFVLDTNILLHNPEAIFGFAQHTVWVPIVVIEEIDTFKKDASELGRNAREVSRLLDQLRRQGRLDQGVDLPQGGKLFVVLTERPLPGGLHVEKRADDRILAVGLDVQERFANDQVILISLDTNMRIRANVLGLLAEDYDTRTVDPQELYAETRTITISEDDLNTFFEAGSLPLPPEDPAYANEYVMLAAGKKTALGRCALPEREILPLPSFREPLWGIKPRNREQYFALDACLREDIHVVTLLGKAGTGKTLLALAAGLHLVADQEAYQRLLVSRPIFPMGRDIGFLPGDIESKLTPWMQPIHDNIETLFTASSRTKRSKNAITDMVNSGVLEVEPLIYIRGRSIAHQYMIVDEAQNLTPHEIKTILTRAGEGTKFIFTGDPFQIDNPYVDSISNGLTYLIDRFRGKALAASVTLHKGERSKLAELAANLL